MTSRTKPALLFVGSSVETVRAATQAILDILNTKIPEEKTKRVALEALQSLCSVNNTSITNCNFQG